MPTYSLPAGDAFALKIPLLVDGAPELIDGWQVWLALTRAPRDADDQAFVLLSLGDGIEPFDANNWIAEFRAEDREKCRTSPLRTYLYFVRAKSPDGKPYTLETGTIPLTPARPDAAAA